MITFREKSLDFNPKNFPPGSFVILDGNDTFALVIEWYPNGEARVFIFDEKNGNGYFENWETDEDPVVISYSRGKIFSMEVGSV